MQTNAHDAQPDGRRWRPRAGPAPRQLLQGTKAYGVHVHRLPVPAREDRRAIRTTNFYWLQEDYIRGAPRGPGLALHHLAARRWCSASALGVAMNLIPIIGAYGAICRETGPAVHLPGRARPRHRGGRRRPDRRGAGLGGDSAGRARTRPSTSPTATSSSGRTSGRRSPTRWACEPASGDAGAALGVACRARRVWDRIVASARPQTRRRWPTWSASRTTTPTSCSAWGATAPISPALVSTIKLRQAGFGDCVDTEAMFRKWFRLFQDKRFLPPT